MDLATSAGQFGTDKCEALCSMAAPAALTSAEFLTAALMQARVGTWQVDLFTGMATWDAVASDMCGLPARPMSVAEGLPIHVDDRAAVHDRFERHALLGGADNIEFRIVRPDGEIRWLEAKGRRLDTGDCPGRYLVGIVTDVTEQRLAARNMQEAEERYRLISQVTTDIIFDWDISQDQIRWNEAKGAFFGYNSDELSSMSMLRGRIHADDQARVVEEFSQLFSGSEANYASDHRLQNSRGEYSDIHACGSVVRDASGRPIRLIGSIQDITERRYADAALRESEAINRGIVEASTDSVVLLDLEGRLLFLNRTGGLTTKVKDMAASYGQYWTSVWPRHAQPGIANAVAIAADGGIGKITESFTHKGQRRWWDIVVSPIRDDAGVPIKLVAIARDITQRREADEKLRRAATHDALTDLPNRACFQDRLNRAVAREGAGAGRLGLLLLDVDDFKQVNDTLGHDAGDALLKSIASRLHVPSNRPTAIARLGGDEFAILLENVEDEAELSAYGLAILNRMKEPLVHAGRVLDCQVTIGAALFPEHAGTPDELFKNADIALYIAKKSGRGALTTFEPKHRDGLRQRAEMVSIGRAATKDDRVVPFYQPKLTLRDRTIHGFEALLRWRHPTQGIQLPATIAAAFEDLEVATAISRKMIDSVIAEMRGWLDQGHAFGHVAVNAAAAEFRCDRFAESVLERLHSAGVPTSCFQLEVTETVFLGQGAESVERALKLLAGEGVRIALDDFGTGYASLRHLRQYPVHVIKIDQGFVRGMDASAEDAAIIAAVINLGTSLSIDVVAEGIETVAQEMHLRELGCEYGQGFLYSKAVPCASVPDLLKAFAARDKRRA